MTPELTCQSCRQNRYEKDENLQRARTASVEDLDGVELGLLGYTISLGANGAGDVCAVTIAVSVVAIFGKVGQPCGTTLKLLQIMSALL